MPDEEMKLIDDYMDELKRHIDHYEEIDCKTNHYERLYREYNLILKALNRLKEAETLLKIEKESNEALSAAIENSRENKVKRINSLQELEIVMRGNTELNITLNRNVMQEIEHKLINNISKNKIKEIILKIDNVKKLAEEQIETETIIADSDSLNYGRKEAHEVDKKLLQQLLGDDPNVRSN